MNNPRSVCWIIRENPVFEGHFEFESEIDESIQIEIYQRVYMCVRNGIRRYFIEEEINHSIGNFATNLFVSRWRLR